MTVPIKVVQIVQMGGQGVTTLASLPLTWVIWTVAGLLLWSMLGVWLFIGPAILVATAIAARLALRSETGLWVPYGAGGKITTSVDVVRAHACTMCRPNHIYAIAAIRTPAIAAQAWMDAGLIYVCAVHLAMLEAQRSRWAITAGGDR